VRALDPQTLSITATCFQYHGTGRGTGLKIRSSQEGVGSSPNFGTHAVVPSPWLTEFLREQGDTCCSPVFHANQPLWHQAQHS
jgi:hypothetical protein